MASDFSIPCIWANVKGFHANKLSYLGTEEFLAKAQRRGFHHCIFKGANLESKYGYLWIEIWILANRTTVKKHLEAMVAARRIQKNGIGKGAW